MCISFPFSTLFHYFVGPINLHAGNFSPLFVVLSMWVCHNLALTLGPLGHIGSVISRRDFKMRGWNEAFCCLALQEINTRCRHWCSNDYPGWWACYFDCKEILQIYHSFHSKGSCAHFWQGNWPPLHVHTYLSLSFHCPPTWQRRHLIFVIRKFGPTYRSLVYWKYEPCVFLLFVTYSTLTVLVERINAVPNHGIFCPYQYCFHLLNS